MRHEFQDHVLMSCSQVACSLSYVLPPASNCKLICSSLSFVPGDDVSGFDPETRAKLGLTAPKAGAAPPTGTEDMTAMQRIEVRRGADKLTRIHRHLAQRT